MIQAQFLVPVPMVLVPGSSNRQIEVSVSRWVKPRYLVIPRDDAKWFQIIDVKIGRNSQLLSAGEIPAAAFAGRTKILSVNSEAGIHEIKLNHPIPVAFDVAGPDRPIRLLVRNIAPWALNFSSVFYGEIAE